MAFLCCVCLFSVFGSVTCTCTWHPCAFDIFVYKHVHMLYIFIIFIIIFHNIYKVIVATQSPKLVTKTCTSFVRFSNFQFWFLSGFLIHRHTRTGVCTLCKFAKIFSKKVKSPLSWVANQRCPGWQMFDSSLRHVLQIT